jgi:lysozyme
MISPLVVWAGNDPLKTRLILEEGVRHRAYRDHLGNWTTGVGHLIRRNELWLINAVLTDSQIYGLLNSDIAILRNDLRRKIPWIYLQPANVVLVLELMAFQLGVEGLLKFNNTLALIKDGKLSLAQQHALRSLWAKQTPERAKRTLKLLV